MSASDLMVIFRYHDGALGLTGWGVFYLVLFLLSIQSRGWGK